jgi:hypothetical protein
MPAGANKQLTDAFVYLGATVFTGYFLNYAQTELDILAHQVVAIAQATSESLSTIPSGGSMPTFEKECDCRAGRLAHSNPVGTSGGRRRTG